MSFRLYTAQSFIYFFRESVYRGIFQSESIVIGDYLHNPIPLTRHLPSSDIELKYNNISVLEDIFLALLTYESLFLCDVHVAAEFL